MNDSPRQARLAALIPLVVGLLLVALAAAGVAYAGYLAVNETLIMAHTDRQFYGRVMSVYLLSFGLMPVGGTRACDACSHAYAYPSSLGSVYAWPRKPRPGPPQPPQKAGHRPGIAAVG